MVVLIDEVSIFLPFPLQCFLSPVDICWKVSLYGDQCMGSRRLWIDMCAWGQTCKPHVHVQTHARTHACTMQACPKLMDGVKNTKGRYHGNIPATLGNLLRYLYSPSIPFSRSSMRLLMHTCEKLMSKQQIEMICSKH